MVQASATNPTGTTLTFGLTHVPKKMEGFPVNQQQTFTMDLAAAGPIGSAEMATALKDGEIIVSLLREHPDEMAALFNYIVAGKTEEANKLAERLELSEGRFLQEGGGMWMYIALAGAVIFYYAARSG
jgi:hypothetical protein